MAILLQLVTSQRGKIFCAEGMLLKLTFLKLSDVTGPSVICLYLQLQFQKQMAAVSILSSVRDVVLKRVFQFV